MTIIYLKKPKVSHLKCDKFSATLKIEDQYHSSVKARVNELIDAGYAKSKNYSAYQTSARLYIGDNNRYFVLIQCGPRSYHKNYSYFRIEYSPHNIGMDGLAELKMRLDEILPFGYDGFISEGICTRFDATVDISHININYLLFSCSKMKISKVYYRDGGISLFDCSLPMSSYILGGESSSRKISIYDKKRQLAYLNKKHPKYAQKLPDHEVTRIEVQHRFRIPISNLHKVANPFEKLGVASFNNIPIKDDPTFDLFILAARFVGAQNAQLALRKKLREKYSQYLKQSGPDWWDPDVIWEQWPSVIHNICHPGTCPLKVGELEVC